MAGRQNFIMSNFTDQKYFVVTATGGVPYTEAQRIGVNSGSEGVGAMNRINVGETLSFELSSCLEGFKMTGLEVVLSSGNATGSVELYDGMTLVKTLPYSVTGGGNFTVKYIASFENDHVLVPYFTKVTFKPATGWLNVRGFQPNINNGGPTTKFYLANLLEAVYMRNNNSGSGNVRYINPGPFPSALDVLATRQLKQPDPSGEFTAGGNEWLKISADGGSLFFNGLSGQMRLGVQGETGNAGAIETGESIIIEPGADFPSNHFAAFEFREATGLNQKLNVELYDGMDMVGSFQTTGINENYNLFYGSRPFNKVVVSGTVSPASLAAIGRSSRRVMSAFPSCPKSQPE
jgi:hypothetical protein